MQESIPEHMKEEQAKELNKLRREFFTADSQEALVAEMDERKTELKAKGEVVIRRTKIGRNDPCPCGSGRKFKKCCVFKVRT